jgi:hypothetical protein
VTVQQDAKFHITFVSEGKITQPPVAIIGKILTERNVSMLYSCELRVYNGHCDALLSVEKRDYIFLTELILTGNFFQKQIPPH